MTEKVTFKYFEGRDVEQFTFYRIPKQLFTVSFFKSLSSDAKILYGLMLDRISLSLKNNWFDEENRAYIYFSIEEVMELLGCGKNKAIKCMKELDEDTGIGLTRKRRQGCGRSNMFYVKTFLVESEKVLQRGQSQRVGTGDTVDHAQSPGEYINQSPEERYVLSRCDERQLYPGINNTGVYDGGTTAGASETSSRMPVDTPNQTSALVDGDARYTVNQTSVPKHGAAKAAENIPEDYFLNTENAPKESPVRQSSQYSAQRAIDPAPAETLTRANGYDKKFDNQTCGSSGPDTEVYISNLKKFEKQTSRSPKNKLQEVYFSNPNNTNNNKTEYSDITSNRIVSGNGDSLSIGAGPEDTMRCDPKDTRQLIQGNIVTGEEAGAVYTLIRNNIALEDLLAARQEDRDLIMEMYSLIVEMVSCRSQEIIIASCRYPAEIVRNRFLKIKYDHIIYVMDCLDKNTTKVKNIRKYLLAALFNAPATIDSYYRVEVHHDMVENVYGFSQEA